MGNLTKFAAIVFITLVALYLVKIFDISYPLTIVSTNRSSELSVVGEGKIDVVPDTAYVDAGISITDGKTVSDVQKTIDEINNKIIAAVSGLGIKKEDIKTSNYSINPNYRFEASANTITGYNGNVTVSVKIKDTKKVADVVTKVTEAGANQVNGVRFTIDSPEKLREEARDKAITNAKDQANILAKKLGIRLGKIVNIVEVNENPRPVPMFESAVGKGAAMVAPQIEPGTQTITSMVTLFFERK